MAQVQEVTGFMGRNRKQPLADVTPQDLTGRERVLKSAARLLLDVGYQRMTLGRISEESGVGGLEIRRWYKTKDEILAALTEQLKRLILTQALEIFGVPEKKIELLLVELETQKEKMLEIGQQLFEELRDR
jgi:AcrR family transcriptional regulator